MKSQISARALLAIALLGAMVSFCVFTLSRNSNHTPVGSANASETVKVDCDFTRMNPTMRMTYIYRLAVHPKEFVGKMLRISGTFLTRVDENDGKRYFGCLMGDPGGCSCCASGGVLEFMPKDSCGWATNFPPIGSSVTVTGRLKMFKADQSEQAFTIPRLVDVEVSVGK